MGLAYELIVFLVIVGCLVVTILASSIYNIFTRGSSREEDVKEMSDDQRHYMQKIRLENRRRLVYESRR